MDTVPFPVKVSTLSPWVMVMPLMRLSPAVSAYSLPPNVAVIALLAVMVGMHGLLVPGIVSVSVPSTGSAL